MAVKVAGEARTADSYELTEKKLTLSGLPKGAFELEIETEIKPQVGQMLQTGLSCLCMTRTSNAGSMHSATSCYLTKWHSGNVKQLFFNRLLLTSLQAVIMPTS